MKIKIGDAIISFIFEFFLRFVQNLNLNEIVWYLKVYQVIKEIWNEI